MLLLCAVAGMPACQAMSPHSAGATTASWADTSFRPAPEYLTYMHMLAVAQPATQKGIYQQAAQIYRAEQTPHAKLRFALALGMLDTPYGDVAKASQMYKELLQPGEPVPPEIESLLQVRLGEARHRLALEEHLALLQQSLDKAEAKIQALTTIEKTLEQPVPETKTKAVP